MDLTLARNKRHKSNSSTLSKSSLSTSSISKLSITQIENIKSLYLSYITKVLNIIIEYENISINKLTYQTYKHCELLLYDVYNIKNNILILNKKYDIDNNYMNISNKLINNVENIGEQLIREHCKLGKDIPSINNNDIFNKNTNNNEIKNDNKDVDIKLFLKYVNNELFNSEQQLQLKSVFTAIDGLEEILKDDNIDTVPINSRLKELKRIVVEIINMAILENNKLKDGTTTNTERYIGGLFCSNQPFDSNLVNKENKIKELLKLAEHERIRSYNIIDKINKPTITENYDKNFTALSTICRKPTVVFSKKPRFNEFKKVKTSIINPNINSIKPNIQTTSFGKPPHKTTIKNVKYSTLMKPELINPILPIKHIPSIKMTSSTTLSRVAKPQLPGPGKYYKETKISSKGCIVFLPPKRLNKKKYIAMHGSLPETLSTFNTKNGFVLAHTPHISYALKLKQFREYRKLKNDSLNLKEEIVIPKAVRQQVLSKPKNLTLVVDKKRDLIPNFNLLRYRKPAYSFFKFTSQKKKIRGTTYYWKKYLISLQNCPIAVPKKVNTFNPTAPPKQPIKELESRFYPLFEPASIKLNKRPAWGYFSGDDIELFEDDELEINNNGMPRNKIRGNGFGAGYKSDTEVANVIRQDREAFIAEEYFNPNKLVSKFGFGDLKGRDSEDDLSDDNVLIEYKKGYAQKFQNGEFSKRDRISDDEDSNDQLELNVDDHLLRPRHPNAIFAKPILKQKIGDAHSYSIVDTKTETNNSKKFQRFSTYDKEEDLSSEDDKILIDTSTKNVIRGGNFRFIDDKDEELMHEESLPVGYSTSQIRGLSMDKQISRKNIAVSGRELTDPSTLPTATSYGFDITEREENDEEEKVELDVNYEKLLPNIPSAVFDMQERFRESIESDDGGANTLLSATKSIDFLRKHVPTAVFSALRYKPYVPSEPVRPPSPPRPLPPVIKKNNKKPDMRSQRQIEADRLKAIDEDKEFGDASGEDEEGSAFGAFGKPSKPSGRTIIKTRKNDAVVGGTASLLKYTGRSEQNSARSRPPSAPSSALNSARNTSLISSLSSNIQNLNLNINTVKLPTSTSSLTAMLNKSINSKSEYD